MKENKKEIRYEETLISAFREFLLQNIRALWDGERLRDKLIFSLILSGFLLFFVFKTVPKNQIIIFIPFFLGGIFGILFGGITILHFSKKIVNNFYPWGPFKRKLIWGVSVIVICRLIDQLLELGKFLLNYFYLPMSIAFFVCVFISLLWLIKYEKKNGIVYICKKISTKGNGKRSGIK